MATERRGLMRLLKILFYVWLCFLSCLSLLGFCLLGSVSFSSWSRHEYRLLPEQRVREQFEKNRSDYIQLVTLLEKDKSAHFIDRAGQVDSKGMHSRLVPEYAYFMR